MRRIAVAAWTAIIGLVALVGCGSKEKVLLRVDGEPITRGELDVAVDYLKSYLPSDSPERQLVTSALQDDLIPNAAIRVAFKDRIPPLLEKANAARKRILAGEDFAAIAKAESDDKVTKTAGGDMGTKQRNDLVAPLGRVAFTLKDGEVSEPVLTVYGIHLIKRTRFLKGATPLDDAVAVSQISYAFGSGLKGRLEWEKVLADAANKTEVVDPTIAEFIPGKFKPKKSNG